MLWDAAEAARRLSVREHEGREILARLNADGLIGREGDAYRNAPVPEKLALIESLTEYGCPLRSIYTFELIEKSDAVAISSDRPATRLSCFIVDRTDAREGSSDTFEV
jgi:hypothetical protein